MATKKPASKSAGAGTSGATSKKRERVSLQSPVGRATFVYIWEPHKWEDDDNSSREPKYSIMLVFDSEQHAELKALRLACIRTAKERFGENAQDMIKRGKLAMPWRDAGEYADYGEPFEDGKIMIKFQTTNAPGVVGPNARPVVKHEEIYSGMRARVTYAPWAYDTKGNKGVTLLLNNVQKTADDTRLSGRAAAEDEFEAVEGGDADEYDDDEDDV